MKKVFIIVLVLFTGTVFFGYAKPPKKPDPTKGYATTLEEAHPDRFEKTKIGMSIDEFKSVWPEAARSGVSADSETYEFVYYHLVKWIIKGAYDYKIYTTFYFINGKLVKYESTQRTGL